MPNTHPRRIIARIFYTTPFVIVVAAVGFLFHQPLWMLIQWIGFNLWMFFRAVPVVVFGFILLFNLFFPVVPALILLGIEARISKWAKTSMNWYDTRRVVIILTCCCYTMWIMGGAVAADLGMLGPNVQPKAIDASSMESVLSATLDLWVLLVPYLLTYVPTLVVALYRGYRAIGRKIEG